MHPSVFAMAVNTYCSCIMWSSVLYVYVRWPQPCTTPLDMTSFCGQQSSPVILQTLSKQPWPDRTWTIFLGSRVPTPFGKLANSWEFDLGHCQPPSVGQQASLQQLGMICCKSDFCIVDIHSQLIQEGVRRHVTDWITWEVIVHF